MLLVALRIAVGWYFFESGRSKNLDREFSSAGFLSQATGPLEGLYKAGLPGHHEFAQHMQGPLEDSPNPHPAGTAAWQAFAARPYTDWLETIVIDFGRTKKAAAGHFTFDENQDLQALRLLAFHEGRLRDYFATSGDELATYRYELARLAEWQASESSTEVPFAQQRIAAKKKELAANAAAFKAAVEAIENDYRSDLMALAPPAIRDQHGDLPRSTGPSAGLDHFIMVSHFLIGGCLVVGLFSRLAAAGGSLFLLLVIGSQPPWVVGYSTIGYQIVMMLACLLLLATSAGRWCGLDYFVRKMLAGSRGGRSATRDHDSEDPAMKPA